jgi:hypothetical protein
VQEQRRTADETRGKAEEGIGVEVLERLIVGKGKRRMKKLE